MKEQIKIALNKEYDKNIQMYGEKHILGTFLVGMANYGFAETEDEFSFITIYIPKFEEMCIGEMSPPKKIENNRFIDIRYFYQIMKNKKTIALELLFSSDYIITPTYESVFNEYFLDNREIIGRANPADRIQKAHDRAKDSFMNGNYFEAMRLYYAACEYMEGESLDKCYHIENILTKKILWSYKKDKSPYFDYHEILHEFENMLKKLNHDSDNSTAGELIKKGTIAIITKSFEEHMSNEAFEEILTNAELKAWNYIKENLDEENKLNISITNAIADTNISRPIWNRLMNKMKNNNIANVVTKGMKGTAIEVLIKI